LPAVLALGTAYKLFVLKALANNLFENLREALGVSALTTIETKTLLIKIPEKVERLNAYIRAFQRPLE
jgi:hypothetical protein